LRDKLDMRMPRARLDLAEQAQISDAVARRGVVKGGAVPANRGAQFRSKDDRHALGRFTLVQSMRRVRSAEKDVAMKSFSA
jgi:transposase InsO family protein